MLGIGIGLTRETSDLMTGQYFKRRREFVEIIVQSGAGIGLTLVSTILRYSVGWVSQFYTEVYLAQSVSKLVT